MFVLTVEVRVSHRSGVRHDVIRSAVEAFILKTHEHINIPNVFQTWAGDPVLEGDVELIQVTESGTFRSLSEESEFESDVSY
jgi:hypothetical protein